MRKVMIDETRYFVKSASGNDDIVCPLMSDPQDDAVCYSTCAWFSIDSSMPVDYAMCRDTTIGEIERNEENQQSLDSQK